MAASKLFSCVGESRGTVTARAPLSTGTVARTGSAAFTGLGACGLLMRLSLLFTAEIFFFSGMLRGPCAVLPAISVLYQTGPHGRNRNTYHTAANAAVP